MSPKATNLFFMISSAALLMMIGLAANEISAATVKKSKTAKKTAVKEKVLAEKGQCTKRELSLQDCELRIGKTKLNLFQGRWRFDDGLWLSVNDMPVAGELVQWDKISFEQHNNRRILQMWVWSKPTGEAEVQNLNWFVMELGEFESPKRVHEVVQRRRLGARVTDSTRKPATQQAIYIYDPRDKTALQTTKTQIKWSAGRRHGEF